MNRFANANTAGKLSKTVPSPNPGFTKLAGARYTPTIGKVEDFAHGGNLRTLVGARICKVFDLDVSWWFLSPANFVKPGFCKGTIFDSAHTATGLVADARALRVCFYGSVAAQMAGEQGLQAETMAAAASESRLEERCGNHVFFDKVLERSYNDYGYWADGAYHYNICDYLGNVRTVVKSDGTLCERNDYYPFGMLHDPTVANADVQPRKYGGKELDRQNGLDLYDSQARWYDPVLARTTTMDQLAEATPDISPYAWCAANPVRNIDPDGRSTWVINVGNGKYSIMGGDIEDKDPNIYVYSEDEHGVYQFTGESIGETPVLTSFYKSDSNEKEKWQIGAIIDTNDQSGIKFLTHIINDNPPLLDYMLKARNGHPYD